MTDVVYCGRCDREVAAEERFRECLELPHPLYLCRVTGEATLAPGMVPTGGHLRRKPLNLRPDGSEPRQPAAEPIERHNALKRKLL